MDAGIQEATVTSDGGLNQRLAKIWRELNGFNKPYMLEGE